jgi:tetratricopeptide (TPR) repeat protein
MRTVRLCGALFSGLLMACDFVAALPGGQDSAAPAKASASAQEAEPPPAAIVKAPTTAELLRSCPLESPNFSDLHKLLDEGEFAKVDATLDTQLEGHQKAPACESHLWETVGFFCSLDFAHHLDPWAAARPDSWGAFSARACQWISTGYERRGTALAKDVTDAQWAGMRDAFARAESDLTRALEIEPDAYVAYGYAIFMLKASGGPGQIRKWLDALVARDPFNYGVRRRAMQSLSPQWGGSIEAMRQVAMDAQGFADGNPRLRILPGYAEAEAAAIDWRAGRIKEAARGYRRALAYGALAEWYAGLADCLTRLGFWPKLLETSEEWMAELGDDGWPRMWRGRARAELGDLAGALVDLDQAHAESPKDATILGLRGVARWRAGRLREAADDFRLALEIEPDDTWALEQLRTLEALDAKSAPAVATASKEASVPKLQGERTLPALSRLELEPANK